jgi:hypothetical protein
MVQRLLYILSDNNERGNNNGISSCPHSDSTPCLGTIADTGICYINRQKTIGETTMTKAERTQHNQERERVNTFILSRMAELLGYDPTGKGESEERSIAHERAYSEYQALRLSGQW